MRLNDPSTLSRLRELEEARIRAIVREEIVNALGALAREADHQDMPYETGELESSALQALRKAAEGTVTRLTCPHEEYALWNDRRCARCSEPEPAPSNPFEDKELEPGCNHAFARDDATGVDVCQLCEGVKRNG